MNTQPAPTMSNDLAPLVRAFLRRTPYSQEDLARAAGVSLGTVSNVVRGKPHSPESADKILDAIDHLKGIDRVGGLDTAVRVEQVAERLAEMQARIDELETILERVMRRLDG